MDHEKAASYLESMLGKKLRIHTVDLRMFVGDFKCTDNECNIILSQSYEYRLPSPENVEAAALRSSTSTMRMNMTSRFLGLIVVPGQYITKIEIEEPCQGETKISV